jgi:hypothetical protein
MVDVDIHLAPAERPTTLSRVEVPESSTGRVVLDDLQEPLSKRVMVPGVPGLSMPIRAITYRAWSGIRLVSAG